MCLIAVLHRMIDDVPIIMAANREEAYARGGTTLDLRPGPLPFVAGIDPIAGGTWFGMNSSRVIIAVTNRKKSKIAEQPRSRGLLVTELLACRSAREASQHAAKALATDQYAGCNLLCADSDSLWIIHGGDWLRVRSLAPGFHILTNGDVNDPTDPRCVWALETLYQSVPRTLDESFDALRMIACQGGLPVPICLHGPERGTVAGTLLALHERPRRGRLFHANGPPDQTAYADRTDLLWELESLEQKAKR
ncbi:MAG: NRDE family protein [Planctomycetes bacterium]|nr:NRDE family protein [Planctomycetota bacterium]